MTYGHGGDLVSAQLDYHGPVLDFSANLNPLGAPEAVKRAAARAAAGEAERYPDPLCRALRAGIAGTDGVAAEQVLCGNGAAELIFRLALALRPGRALLTAPTFSEYEQALDTVGCRVERCALDRGRQFDLDEGFLERIVPGVELVFLCNPNNPTGRLIDPALLEGALARCEQVGAVLAVDECFLGLSDAAGAGLAPLVAGHPRLLLLRAFTKTYAVAGLRLGYCLCSDGALLEAMGRCGQPWSVSAPAQAAGLAALACPRWPEKARALVDVERPRLVRALEGLGFLVCPGQANYLLFRAPGLPDLKQRLLARGVLIRACGNYHGLDEYDYRVCVRTGEENGRLVDAIREVR